MNGKLILWDIDGTLLRTHGAGMRAMYRAAACVFGETFSFDGVEPAGNLDPLILAAAARRCGVVLADHHRSAFLETYCRMLPEELAASGPNLRVMPGVPETLAAMRDRPHLTLGLLTGNYPATAKLKLAAGGIDWSIFALGAFGDDADDRPSLVPVAMRKYEQLRGRRLTPRDVLLIGDTPRDVYAAKTHGAVAVAVATGPYSVAELRETGADLVLADLSDAAPLWQLIES